MKLFIIILFYYFWISIADNLYASPHHQIEKGIKYSVLIFIWRLLVKLSTQYLHIFLYAQTYNASQIDHTTLSS